MICVMSEGGGGVMMGELGMGLGQDGDEMVSETSRVSAVCFISTGLFRGPD